MSIPRHYMHRKLEDLLKAFLEQESEKSETIYTFMEVVGLGDSVKEPFVSVRCQNSSPAAPEVSLAVSLGAPSRVINATIRVRTHAENLTVDAETITAYRDVHEDFVKKVVDTFYCTDLIDRLNAIAVAEGMGINVEQIDQPEMNDNPENRSGVTEIVFPIYCNPVTT